MEHLHRDDCERGAQDLAAQPVAAGWRQVHREEGALAVPVPCERLPRQTLRVLGGVVHEGHLQAEPLVQRSDRPREGVGGGAEHVRQVGGEVQGADLGGALHGDRAKQVRVLTRVSEAETKSHPPPARRGRLRPPLCPPV